MPRKDFVRDLQEVSNRGESSGAHPHVVDIRSGDDDGTIAFTYVPGASSNQPIDIQAFVSDISSYPRHHSYFIYTTSDNVPSTVTTYLEQIGSALEGLAVSDLLTQVSETLHQALTTTNDSPSPFDCDSDEDMEDDFGFSDNDNDDDWSPEEAPRGLDRRSTTTPASTGDESVLRAKVSEDLRKAKLAGFKAGYLGNVGGQIIVCISCRIAKLGISEEAMHAWSVNPRQYLVFLIRFPSEYRDLDEILQHDSVGIKLGPEMQVSLCDSYKPSYSAALDTFQGSTTFEFQSSQLAPPKQGPNAHLLTPSFINKPLNALLNERFIKILKYRFSYGLEWSAAEHFYNDIQGKYLDADEQIDTRYISPEMQESPTSSLPDLVTADHVKKAVSSSKASFPLIGMQFVLRHFVRCTEFCLVCHCKIDADFEALKPYVCSKSLCLFQYMALGFGPSLEWEIMSQPYVVDLLISFTYSSAISGRLRDFPTGLGINVPTEFEDTNLKITPHQKRKDLESTPHMYCAKLDRPKLELALVESDASSPICVGDWLMIVRYMGGGYLHCRVQDISSWPTVKLSEPIHVTSYQSNQQKPEPSERPEEVRAYVYNENFDRFSDDRKRSMMAMLLDTLPDVDQMKEFLENQRSTEPSLAQWRDRISKSALDVLRWIVASNRSCIIQDGQSLPEKSGNKNSKNSKSVNETLVSGMEGYMQFRLAQGAPDKEHRFVGAVAQVTKSLNLKYPTLFAWHGSQLGNWHGIVREGLHFRDVTNGRAYGHGVYLSPQFHVSSGYASDFYFQNSSYAWHQSKLKITSAISLNEVVNAPSQFVSQTPHLVVNNLDWIQPRYLFVRCKSLQKADQPQITPPPVFYQQDPKYTAIGPNSQPAVIPITAFSQRRRVQCTRSLTGKVKESVGLLQSAPDEVMSDATDDEDLAILKPVPGKVETRHVDKKGKDALQAKARASKTDFVPGSLSGSSLPLLTQPSYATTGATKALQRDLMTTLKIQETEPLHELGWYIDSDLINTVYQWIVELHSFDPDLPLAADLKAAGLTSVVMELRFPKDYPISPPFARIIRPRFLSFMQGGGGHVTAGGALCMELLTNNGWSAVSSIESILLQIRLALSSTDPKPARLELKQGQNVKEYGVGEAVQAFIRACNAHGWEVPKEFDRMTRLELVGSGSSSK